MFQKIHTQFCKPFHKGPESHLSTPGYESQFRREQYALRYFNMYVGQIKTAMRDFWMVQWLRPGPPMQRAQVQSLGQGTRSHIPQLKLPSATIKIEYSLIKN